MVESKRRARASVTYWIVAIVALLWNAFGAYDYLMTRFRDTDYLASMMPGVKPEDMLAWVDSFPLWAQIGWGLGVWGGVAGALLLLARSRWAVAAFALSLLGMALSFGYQFLGSKPPAGIEGGVNTTIPIVIMIIGLALLLYARAQLAKRVIA